MPTTGLIGHSKCITPINPYTDVVRYMLLLLCFIDEMDGEIDIWRRVVTCLKSQRETSCRVGI